MSESRGALPGDGSWWATGSIAAYKAVSLVRLLAERGAIVDVAMTPAAAQFVTPLTFASLTHRPVVDVMALDDDQQIAHVELAEGADAIVIAPATANVLAQLAAGLVSDSVTAIACASRAPVVLAPAMDAGMWTHPATQRNVETLRGFGHYIVEPEVEALASGLTGVGRLAEPGSIVEAVEGLFVRAGDRKGCTWWSARAARVSRWIRSASSAIGAAARWAWPSRRPRAIAAPA